MKVRFGEDAVGNNDMVDGHSIQCPLLPCSRCACVVDKKKNRTAERVYCGQCTRKNCRAWSKNIEVPLTKATAPLGWKPPGALSYGVEVSKDAGRLEQAIAYPRSTTVHRWDESRTGYTYSDCTSEEEDADECLEEAQGGLEKTANPIDD